MITLTIATITYPKKNWGISKMEEFFTLNTVSTGDVCSKCILFFGGGGGKLYQSWLIGNRTSCRQILSVIILVIDKSDSRFAVTRFCESLAWLQTELDYTRSYYHYSLNVTLFTSATFLFLFYYTLLTKGGRKMEKKITKSFVFIPTHSKTMWQCSKYIM